MKDTFKKAERLKSSREIGSLLSEGHYFNSYPLKIFWKTIPGPIGIYPAKAAFIVSKKKFKRAVDRNLIKRRLRESYRTNKHQLYSYLSKNNIGLKIVYMYMPEDIYSYDKILTSMKDTLSGLLDKLNRK